MNLPESPRRRRWPRRALISVDAVLGVLLLVVAAAYAYLRVELSRATTIHVTGLRQHSVASPFNLLVVGSDSREHTGGNTRAFGSPQQVVGQRSDVIKIFHVIPAQHRVRELAIPRDLVVRLPDGSQNRINTAMDQGGASELVRTIETDLHIPIDHYVLVTFAGFEAIVNAVGGIQLYFPYPARDRLSGLHVTTPGCHHLTGAQALAVARSRHYYYQVHGVWHYDPTSDLGRIVRQNEFLSALARKVRGQISNPLSARSIIASLAPHLTIDDGWSTFGMVRLAWAMRHVHVAQLHSTTLPTRVANNYGNLGDVLFPVPQDAQVIARFLSNSQPKPAPSHSPAPTAAPTPSATASPSSSPAPARPPAPSVPAYDPRPC